MVQGTRGKAWIDQDGENVGNDCGLENCVPNRDGVQAGMSLYREIFKSIHSGEKAMTTSLQNCLGFLKTVCGGLISSGGIHPIPQEYVTTVGEGENLCYEVSGIQQVFAEARAQSKLPSQLGVPWAKVGKRVPASEVQKLDLHV
jgi:hypothetical protein